MPQVLNMLDWQRLPRSAVYVADDAHWAKYRAWLLQRPELMAALPELRGKDLVCWCAPEPCHADVLLELANAGPPHG